MNLQFSMAGNVAAKPSDVRELVVELITELLHCSIPALHEIREEWPEELKEQGASPKMILFSEKLVDLVIEQKGDQEAVSIEDIKIFPWFKETPPDPEKVKRRVFPENWPAAVRDRSGQGRPPVGWVHIVFAVKETWD